MRLLPALTAVFFAASVMLQANPISGWFRREVDRIDRQREELKAELKSLGEPYVGQSVPEMGSLHSQVKRGNPNEANYVQVDLGRSFPIDMIALLPASLDAGLASIASYFPREFRIEISEQENFGSATKIAEFAEFLDPGMTPVSFDVSGRARYVRVTVAAPVPFAVGELMVISGNRNVAWGSKVTASAGSEIPPRWDMKNLVDGRSAFGPPIVIEPLAYDGVYSGPPSDDSRAWMMLDLGKPMDLDEIRLHPVHARFNNSMPGYGYPIRLAVECGMDKNFVERTFIEDGSIERPGPGNNPVIFPAIGIRAQFIRITLFQASGYIHGNRFGLSEIEVYSGGKNVARQAVPSTIGDPAPKTRNWPVAGLIDGYTSMGRLLELPDWLKYWRRRQSLIAGIAALDRQHSEALASSNQRMLWVTITLAVLVPGTAFGVLLSSRRRSLRAVAEFRTRLAQDLHDEVGSNLAAVAMLSEGVYKGLVKPGPDEWKEVNQIIREASDAMRETLWIAGGREQIGLDLFRHMQLAASRILSGKTVTWAKGSDSVPMEWASAAQKQVFLFFKETLANIAKHAAAKSVSIACRFEGDWFELEIADDGKGFIFGEESRGIGLFSLQDRARRLGGNVKIESSPGHGTRVFLRVKPPK